jgi:hypothetical protein
VNGLTALGIVLVGSGISLFVLTIIIATYVTSPFSIAGGTLSLFAMMIMGGFVLIAIGGMD